MISLIFFTRQRKKRQSVGVIWSLDLRGHGSEWFSGCGPELYIQPEEQWHPLDNCSLLEQLWEEHKFQQQLVENIEWNKIPEWHR
jgi:hypothetical protein